MSCQFAVVGLNTLPANVEFWVVEHVRVLLHVPALFHCLSLRREVVYFYVIALFTFFPSSPLLLVVLDWLLVGLAANQIADTSSMFIVLEPKSPAFQLEREATDGAAVSTEDADTLLWSTSLPDARYRVIINPQVTIPYTFSLYTSHWPVSRPFPRTDAL